MPKYDAAIIGAGLGGLTAAALLASKGKKTILIDQGMSLTDALGIYERDGFSFAPGPSLSYGFERGGVLHELATALGIVQHTSAHSPCYQVALPDRRITVFAEYAETLEELKREFHDEIDLIGRFYRDLDNTAKQIAKHPVIAAFTRWRSAKGRIAKYGFSSQLAAFFDVQSLYFFQRPTAELSLSELIALCITSPLHPQGGFRTFADHLYGVMLQHGGEVRYKEPTPRISSTGHGALAIQTTQGVVEAGTVLMNTLPSGGRSMLFIALREDVVPVGMSHTVLYVPDYSQPTNYFALSLDAKEETADAPTGMRALSVSFTRKQNVPLDQKILIEQLSGLIPFLNDYLVFAEEYNAHAGHAVLPGDITEKPYRSGKSATLSPTSKDRVFALHDAPEAPLQMLSQVRRFVDKTV